MDKRRYVTESLQKRNKKEEKIILKKRRKEFQVGKVIIFLIVMQTVNLFSKPKIIIIILIITQLNPILPQYLVEYRLNNPSKIILGKSGREQGITTKESQKTWKKVESGLFSLVYKGLKLYVWRGKFLSR